MRLKVSKNSIILKEFITNSIQYCDACSTGKSVGSFNTCIGRVNLCLNCIKKYIREVGDDDYFFISAIKIINDKIMIGNEPLVLLDEEEHEIKPMQVN